MFTYAVFQFRDVLILYLMGGKETDGLPESDIAPPIYLFVWKIVAIIAQGANKERLDGHIKSILLSRYVQGFSI